jgi:chemotaxis protein methyltransferase CheR
LPQLASYPLINFWSVGCATGEEAYSLAIIFKRVGLLAKTRIYATDMNTQAIGHAKQGIYPIHVAQQGCINYQAFNPSGSFTDYFTSRYQRMKLNDDLLQAVSFFTHKLSVAYFKFL